MAKKHKLTIDELFDFTRTEKKAYTKILKGTPHIKGKVVMLPPKVMLDNSYSKTDVTKEPIRHKSEHPTKPRKTKWALPYIDTLREKGYSRGRVLKCLKWGIKEVPVLVVARSEKDIDKWVKKALKNKKWTPLKEKR